MGESKGAKVESHKGKPGQKPCTGIQVPTPPHVQGSCVAGITLRKTVLGPQSPMHITAGGIDELRHHRLEEQGETLEARGD